MSDPTTDPAADAAQQPQPVAWAPADPNAAPAHPAPDAAASDSSTSQEAPEPEAQPDPAPEPEPAAPGPPAADVAPADAVRPAISVGPGMQAQMDANGDHPIGKHWIGPVQDAPGAATYLWEECLGTKGWYYSSNALGHWENVGPF